MSDMSPAAGGIARRPRPSSDLATTVLASVAIALPLMFYLRQHVEILRYGYEIEALEQRRVELAERSRELGVRRASAGAIAGIEERASALGLAAPDPARVFVATPGDAGEPTTSGRERPSIQARLE